MQSLEQIWHCRRTSSHLLNDIDQETRGKLEENMIGWKTARLADVVTYAEHLWQQKKHQREDIAAARGDQQHKAILTPLNSQGNQRAIDQHGLGRRRGRGRGTGRRRAANHYEAGRPCPPDVVCYNCDEKGHEISPNRTIEENGDHRRLKPKPIFPQGD